MSRYATRGMRVDVDDGAPHRADWPDARGYTVTLRFRRRVMRTPFYTGPGWTSRPDLDDVMECLCSDAAGVVNANSFEEWAAELGFDDDSRQAERIYRQVRRQTEELRRLLDGEFDEVVFGLNGREEPA